MLRKIGSHRPRSFVTCRTASEKVFCPNMPNTKGVVASHAPSRMVRKCTHSMSKCTPPHVLGVFAHHFMMGHRIHGLVLVS